MKHRIVATFLLTLATIQISGILDLEIFAKNIQNDLKAEVLGASTTNQAEITHPTKMETETAFEQKEEYEYTTIPFETEYIENTEVLYGKDTVLKEGVEGIITDTHLITHWLGEELNSELIDTVVKEPVTEIIEKGMKVVWNEYPTPDVGGVWYWHKLRVWATKYDGDCIGCSGRTFSGTIVVKGVCATDPDVIPLGTNFYVKGYGLCRAEDIGGAIKGNDVDLGYENAAEAPWGAEYTDVYLITNAPDGSSKY